MGRDPENPRSTGGPSRPDGSAERHTRDLSGEQPFAWKADAACRGVDTALFFPSSYDPISPVVKELCDTCPVRRECLDHAIHHEDDGIWAGTSARRRRKMRVELGVTIAQPEAPTLNTNTTCGTDSGYYRHLRISKTAPCQACREAHAAAAVERDRRRGVATGYQLHECGAPSRYGPCRRLLSEHTHCYMHRKAA